MSKIIPSFLLAKCYSSETYPTFYFLALTLSTYWTARLTSLTKTLFDTLLCYLYHFHNKAVFCCSKTVSVFEKLLTPPPSSTIAKRIPAVCLSFKAWSGADNFLLLQILDHMEINSYTWTLPSALFNVAAEIIDDFLFEWDLIRDVRRDYRCSSHKDHLTHTFPLLRM